MLSCMAVAAVHGRKVSVSAHFSTRLDVLDDLAAIIVETDGWIESVDLTRRGASRGKASVFATVAFQSEAEAVKFSNSINRNGIRRLPRHLSENKLYSLEAGVWSHLLMFVEDRSGTVEKVTKSIRSHGHGKLLNFHGETVSDGGFPNAGVPGFFVRADFVVINDESQRQVLEDLLTWQLDVDLPGRIYVFDLTPPVSGVFHVISAAEPPPLGQRGQAVSVGDRYSQRGAHAKLAELN
jgi:hypothetical protein